MTEIDKNSAELTGELRILVTGGGTGGHVGPALAVITELRELAAQQNWTPHFLYVGSADGLEKRLAAEADIPFVSVASGKMRRASSIRGLFTKENIRDAFQVPIGVQQAFGHIKQFRPHVIFSTGGYVSVPSVIAGGLLKIPVLVHEQTVQVGLANRIAARFATRIALSSDNALQDLSARWRPKAFVTGNPVRKVIFGSGAEGAIEKFGFTSEDNALPTVYVTGGAQGAHVINEAVRELLPELLKLCRVIHQCGRQKGTNTQDYDVLKAAVSNLPLQLQHRYGVTEFVGDEIGDVFALTDVLVGRSGAGTVTEAAALGLPALYIPLVPTGGDEQTKNARRFADIGAAVIVKNAELSAESLLAALSPLLADKAKRQTMSKAALTLARPNATHDLAMALLHMIIVQNR